VRVIRGVNAGLTAPAWSPDSHRFAVATRGGVLLLSTTGKRLGSLGAAADLLLWPRGGLLVVGGQQSQDVLRSVEGRRRLRRLFHLPKNQSALAVDAR
jgi:phage tail tape-measure protein